MSEHGEIHKALIQTHNVPKNFEHLLRSNQRRI